MEPMEDASTVERMLLEHGKQNKIPVNGSIELLPLCNMKCSMCYVRMDRPEMEAKGGLRTGEDWLALGKQMQEAGVLFLLLTGGEPLLHPDFREIYRGLRKKGMILTINTNGTLIDENWADFFAANKPRRINITLYGKDENAYRDLCHYPGGFEKTVNAVKLLKNRGVDVRLGCSVTPQNVKDLDAIQKIAGELDVPVIMDTYMMAAQRERDREYPEDSRMDPVTAANARLFAIRTELGEEMFPQYVQQTLGRVKNYTPGDEKNQMTCLAGSCSFTVNWQGYLRPCVTMTKPSVSVFENGFAEAWKQVCLLRENLRIPSKCVACKKRPLCKICVSAMEAEPLDGEGVPAYLCTYAEHYYTLILQEAEVLGYAENL